MNSGFKKAAWPYLKRKKGIDSYHKKTQIALIESWNSPHIIFQLSWKIFSVPRYNETWSGVGEELEYDYHFLTRTCLLAGCTKTVIVGSTYKKANAKSLWIYNFVFIHIHQRSASISGRASLPIQYLTCQNISQSGTTSPQNTKLEVYLFLLIPSCKLRVGRPFSQVFCNSCHP